MPYEGRKILMSEHCVETESFPVRKYHIDTNEHVNNCQYVQMALEVLPREMKVRQLRVDYKKSSLCWRYDPSESGTGDGADSGGTVRWRWETLCSGGIKIK